MKKTRSIPELTEEQERNFLKKINKTEGGSNDDCCWEWTGAVNPNGYGQFSLSKKAYMSHRISYFLANGRAPGDLNVCHECDNPLCVRPSHLWVGTQQQNISDRDKKGRTLKGSNHHKAKLTEKEVREIRSRYADGITHKALASEFNIHPSTIWSIVRRVIWTHLPQRECEIPRALDDPEMTEEEVMEIIRHFEGREMIDQKYCEKMPAHLDLFSYEIR